MGEVYRARDTKLGREVALKTLPDELARQPDRLARLRQEARILAALNHPGIATLYGLEESGNGVPVLVMELVAGESLADRIRRGALPQAEALKVAHAVAVALEAAHEKGVLHRDLKPGNIHLAGEGRVKLLDFGLAKAVRDAGGLDSHVATQTSPSSGAAIVGTAPYLSPEQARGQEIDRRSDVWAFGCVLFEMLTRKRAFEGSTFSDTMAAILDREPDWSALPAGTPPLARRLLVRCLQKDKDKRLHDIADVRLELDELLSASGGSEASQAPAFASPPRASWRTWFGSRLVWLIAGAVAAGVAVRALGRSTPVIERPRVRLAIPLEGAVPVPGMAWSADATRVVYAALREGRVRLYVRALDGLESTPVPGTEDATQPFCSPDGRWLAFSTGGAGGFPALKKVPLGGGTPIRICEECGSFGATWGPDDTIVYTPDQASGLFRLKAEGGAPEPVTVLEADRHETSHRFPEILPDGRAVVFTVKPDDALSWDDARIEAVSLRTRERAVLVRGGSFARYVPPGFLVYHRAAALWAVPFDAARLEVTGPASMVLEGLFSSAEDGHLNLGISRDGSLAYVPGIPKGLDRRIVRVDRAGKREALFEMRNHFGGLSLSPDGRRLAITIGGPNDQIWIYDLERGSMTPLTRGWINTVPTWTPDGRRIAFMSSRGGKPNLFWQPVDGSGPAERLSTSAEQQNPLAWSPDGKSLFFTEGVDLRILSLGADQRPQPFLQGPSFYDFAAVSPNGHWLAFTSEESGRREVYMRPLPGPGSRWAISADGGEQPVWSRNGREIFYVSHGRMMAVTVTGDATLSVSKPRFLFDARLWPTVERTYDVTPDGDFVMIERGESDAPRTQINVVLNWAQEVAKRVAAR
jgi:serine/threonine-protein kinase